MFKKSVKMLVIGCILSLTLLFCKEEAQATVKGKPAPFRQHKEDTEVANTKFGDFSTYDLEGNEVTQEIFSQTDLTVVNIWGTYCGPCIDEMSELGEWAKEMDEHVQIIGFVIDIQDENDMKQIKTAKTIVNMTGADYTHVIAGGSDFIKKFENVDVVPTTLFVDKEGNLVGKQIQGAYVEGYQQVVKDYFQKK